jgi:hypothetical protein
MFSQMPVGPHISFPEQVANPEVIQTHDQLMSEVVGQKRASFLDNAKEALSFVSREAFIRVPDAFGFATGGLAIALLSKVNEFGLSGRPLLNALEVTHSFAEGQTLVVLAGLGFATYIAAQAKFSDILWKEDLVHNYDYLESIGVPSFLLKTYDFHHDQNVEEVKNFREKRAKSSPTESTSNTVLEPSSVSVNN